MNEMTHRTKTRPVKVGNLTIGGNNELIIQSMTTTKTHDVEATVAEIKRFPIVLHSKDGSVIYAAPCMDAHVKATGPNSFICYTETLEPLEEELTLTKGY